jgi:hypothetical protein
MKILPSFLVTTFLVGAATLASAKPVRIAPERVQMLETYDINKDGKLDASEKDARRTDRINVRFDRLDSNDDGLISKDEFIAGADQREEHRKAEKADKAKHPNKGKHVKRGRVSPKKVKAAKKTKSV